MADNEHVERFKADVSQFVRDVEKAAHESDQFGDANARAALAARRMGLSAQEAGQRAERAQLAAFEAAKKLERGELDAAKAAELQARAASATERAELKQAESALAAAKAEDELAKNMRQVARDAAVSAGAERLAHLRAAGAAKDHNALLTHLRREYKDFDGDIEKMGTFASNAFDLVKTAGSSALSTIGSMGPLMIGAIVAGLAVLPAAATLAGGAISVGLGGAFALVGLKATAGSAVAKRAIDDMSAHTHAVVQDFSKPFEQTWVNIAAAEKTALDGMAPDVKNLFQSLAPEVSGFAQEVGHKIPGELHNFFESLKADSGPIIAELGSTLPEALGRAADGLKQIMDEVARNPQEFGNMIAATGRLVQALGTVMVWLIKVGEVFTRLNATTGQLGAKFQELGQKAGFAGQPLSALGGFMRRFDVSSAAAGNTLTNFGSNLANAAAQAGAAATATGRLTQANNQLEQSIQRILNPALAYSNDAIAMKESQIQLTAALKASHGQMGLQTQQSRAASSAFNDLAAKVAQMRDDEVKLHGATSPASQAIKDQVAKLWDLAGSNKEAQDKVIRLAAALGVTLPKSAGTAKKSVDGVHGALNNLKSPAPIDIRVSTANALAAVAAVQSAINNIGRAGGGVVVPPPRFRAEGGPMAYGYAAGGSPRRIDSGGGVWGRGSGKSDDVPLWASTGEYVVKAVSYAANKSLVEAINASNGRPVSLGGEKSGSVLGPGPKNQYLGAMPLARRHYAETLTGASGGASQPIVHDTKIYVNGNIWSADELLNRLQALAIERGISFVRPAGR